MYQKHQTKYPLSGKLYCQEHKCGYVRKIRHYINKPDTIFWYCSDFHKTGRRNCLGACLKEDDLYDILLSVFKTYEAYKEEICEELISLYKEISKEEEKTKQQTTLKNELNLLQKKKDKLLDLALDGFLSKEDLSKKKLSLEEQISQIKSKLKELEGKKNYIEEQETNYEILKTNILKHLIITRDNLENYIEELLDKIIVIEKAAEEKSKKSNIEISNIQKQKSANIELKIILSGDKIIEYGIPQNFSKISHSGQNQKTDYKNNQFCHSHAHC